MAGRREFAIHERHPMLNHLFRIGFPAPQAFFEHFQTRRQEKYQASVGPLRFDLFCSLHLDFEQDIRARRQWHLERRQTRPIEIAVVFSVFEKGACVRQFAKRLLRRNEMVVDAVDFSLSDRASGM
jgi:hypothetical protein